MGYDGEGCQHAELNKRGCEQNIIRNIVQSVANQDRPAGLNPTLSSAKMPRPCCHAVNFSRIRECECAGKCGCRHC
jgi:hypothetical protein